MRDNCNDVNDNVLIKQRSIATVRTRNLDKIQAVKSDLEAKYGCNIHIFDKDNGFEWGSKEAWAKLGKTEMKDDNGDVDHYKYIPVIIFICGTCTRSTEINALGHKRLYAWHDNRELDDGENQKCYNTLSQAISRVKHYSRIDKNGKIIENNILLYCDIDVINYSIGELEDSKIKQLKLGSRIKPELSGLLQIYNDEYETVNDVPENMWMNDTPNDDGDEKPIGTSATLIGKNGKWIHQNGSNYRVLFFNQSNGNTPNGGSRTVLQYKSLDSNDYIIRTYTTDYNVPQTLEHKTTNKSMYS